MTDFIKQVIDMGNFCCIVMLDLQKAFDTVNHNILLYKLRAIGFAPTPYYGWSYLIDRVQRVDVGWTLSDAKEINDGIAQGSILEPLLSLLYINYMDSACSCPLFWDDSALLILHKKKDIVEKTLGIKLTKVSKWLSNSKLSLHLGKTECIPFGSQHKVRNSSNFLVKCNGVELKEKCSATYFGCELDQHMTGELMALKVIGKVHSRKMFLARVAKFLDTETMRTLAISLIQATMTMLVSHVSEA